MKTSWPHSQRLHRYLWKSKENFRYLLLDIGEFWNILKWYFGKKFRFLIVTFEEGKGIIVDILMAQRGAYQRVFLRAGMIGLVVFALFFTPIIVNSYPRSVQSSGPDSLPPSAVPIDQTGLNNLDTQTQESQKPRRDVIAHTVESGETLSSIAKSYNVDVASIKTLNKLSDTDTIHPGDNIKIPPVSGVVITVASGDTIYTLAKKYSLASAQAIVDWPYNVFIDDEKFTLAASQTLVLPGGVPPEAAPVAPVVQRTPDSTPFTRGSGILSWPTVGAITQYFSFYHNGLDIASNSGPAITAADSGRVEAVLYENYGYGYHVIVNHGNGYKTLYGHMSRIDVAVGQNVARGEKLGRMGSTGRSTGTHLHFTVFSNGVSVNPLSLLK